MPFFSSCLKQARRKPKAGVCELQVFLDFDKLVDRSEAQSAWGSALVFRRSKHVLNGDAIKKRWDDHCQYCEQNDLCP